MAESEPRMAKGEAWWSMMKVTPHLALWIAAASALASIISRSRRLSRCHQTYCRISVKLVGVLAGAGMPRARVE